MLISLLLLRRLRVHAAFMDASSRTAKRMRDGIDDRDDDDCAKAMAMLQTVLPLLRPSKQNSQLSASMRLELLMQNWTVSAWQLAGKPSTKVAPELAPFHPTEVAQPWQRQNFKRAVPADVWDLIGSADDEEKPRLVRLVQKLATPRGRAELLAMGGAQCECVDTVEQAARSSDCVREAEPASLLANISKGEHVVLFGAFSLRWAHFNGMCGVVDSYDGYTNRYTVLANNGSLVQVHPRNMARAVSTVRLQRVSTAH